MLGIIGGVFIIATILIIIFLPSPNTKDKDLSYPTNTEAISTELDVVSDIENSLILTEYFSLILPDTWNGNCYYDYYYDNTQIVLSTYMYTESSDRGAHLFTIYLIPMEEIDEITSAIDFGVKPITRIETDIGVCYFVGYRLASEMACAEHEEDLFLSFIDSIPDITSNIDSTEHSIILDWSYRYIDDAPCADITIDILGRSFQSFCNQSGEMIYETENTEYINLFLANLDNSITYYASAKNELIGVKDGYIVFYGIITDALTLDFYSPSVREVINAYEFTPLYDIEPRTTPVSGQPANLYYWKINNGYVGITAYGQAELNNFYSYSSGFFIATNMYELINIQ